MPSVPLKRSAIPRRRSAAAFTLVELLVVIGIIAILIAILLPALKKARSASKVITCASNIRQIMLGITMYADANQGVLPPASSMPPSPYGFNDFAGILIANRNLMNTDVFRCPDDEVPRDTSVIKQPIRSYAINDMHYNAAYLRSVSYHFPWPEYLDYNTTAEPLSKLRQVPLHVFLVSENHGYLRDLYPGTSRAMVSVPEMTSMFFRPANVHPKIGGNYAFNDAHVEFITAKEMAPYLADTPYGNIDKDHWKWTK